MLTTIERKEIVIEIGGLAVCLRTNSAEFRRMLEERYRGFVPSLEHDMPFVVGGSGPATRDSFVFELELLAEGEGAEADVRVWREGPRWVMTRGDFRAEWIPEEGCGRVRQTANPYAIDSVLRIVHTLLLAQEGGFLLHGASAIRNGNAFLFSGKSGAGKTTISRLAPPDVRLLTDEISYVRKSMGASSIDANSDRASSEHYIAYGTPFAGELAKVGDNVSAPIKALYFLEKGLTNRIEQVRTTEATRRLMQNILFFAEDELLVNGVFQAACDFTARVPSYRLEFVPDQRIWELIA